MKEGRGLQWSRAVGVVFCCSCVRKRRPSEKGQLGPEQKRTRNTTELEKENVEKTSGCRLREWIRRRPRLANHNHDDDMDLGTLEHNLNMTLDGLYKDGLQNDKAVHLHNGRQLPNVRSEEAAEPLTLGVKRSHPVRIQTNRKLKEEEPHTSSLPTIPNPFPELCSPSKSPILSGTPSAQSHERAGESLVVKIFSEDNTCRSLEVTATAPAREVCNMLIQKTHCINDNSWSLVEFHPHLALERCLEDHESVAEVQLMWPPGGESKFLFRKNFAKYELFKNPPTLFPEHMITTCLDANKGMSHSELIQNFLNSGSCPEIQGFLHVKELGRKVWKKFYFFLRKSGLYYSTKGTSREPRHLHYYADIDESNVYTVTQGKKHYSALTEFGFCIKPHKARSGTKDLKVLCTDSEQIRTCWMTAFRLFKYGKQLYRNYHISLSKQNPQTWINSTPLRSVSENTLVAMDFSGCTGRVIDNPNEALSVALEEGQAWRKKTSHRYSLPSPCQASTLSAVIHRTQAWFHGRISREESQRLIIQQGLVDGVFLVRESQRNPKGFVLSLCHLQKIKHYLILPYEEDGHLYFTMDDGQTKFTDLIQLVEFHQINRGILPCQLKHRCTSVVL
ncbi:growth factor receptor-bound protein 7 isoform X2 [Latimeria chalumnae]|uniref:growth factor receptor-bound protein 7 isoform X2 n=1 Tax=Latimeria chalumnae TaxID=7897 RepID=UPI00313EE947